MEFVDLPPYAPILMESTRAIGYSSESAIADIIDNSITAGASNVDIDFFPIGDSYIYILDDGHGMSKDKLIAAMQYGSKNPLDVREESDLGRYGLGLKTASLSQCRKLTVISKIEEEIACCCWDLSYVKRKESWALIILSKQEFNKLPGFDKLVKLKSGTLVLWQDLDKFAVGECDIATTFKHKAETIREHLSLVFHRYLDGERGLKKLTIRMNNNEVEAQDPLLVGKSTQLIDTEIINIRGQKVVVTPFVLPHIDKLSTTELKKLGGKDGLRKRQGFYIYRNKRLLVWGTWFKLMRQGELSKLARVRVDIPNSLDDLWTLDIKKSVARPPDEVKKNLSVIIGKIAEGSRRTWTYRGKKETSSEFIHMWNVLQTRDGGVCYEINNSHPLVEDILVRNPSVKVQLEKLLKFIGLSLPLNRLYIDLTNDTKIVNDSEATEKEVIKLFKSTICIVSEEHRQALIESLKIAEPFCNYSDEIENAIAKGLLDD